jgi:Ni,Fe-hydrogenase III small subunit/NAD-dependent dihydropyrimidine dehydrogenase PreA subunit
MAYPAEAPVLPDRFRGLPEVDASRCANGCRACADACPTNAIAIDERGLRLDLGRCLFCTDCMEACPEGAIRYTQDYRLAVRKRNDLILQGPPLQRAKALDEKSRRLFGRSLKLRQVSAAGCNGCESDVNVLSTVVFDLGRFGIHFVASPRHADGLLVTGAVGENMRGALLAAYAAVPAPKLVIAVGACAISGGPFVDNPEVHNGCGSLLPVDLYVPGCPPHPLTILDGLLRLLGRLEQGRSAQEGK